MNTSGKNFVENIDGLLPTVNDSGYKRVLAIGDIHGNFDKLISLWEKLNVTDDDFVICLGDYIDRGDKVDEVVEWVQAQSAKKNFIALMGNHEHEFTNLIISRFHRFFKFFKKLPYCHTMIIGGRKYIFVHGGIVNGVPLEEQDKNFMVWAREEFYNAYDGEDVVITGHTPIQVFGKSYQENPRPLRIPGRNILMLDTGSFLKRGYISCVDIISGQYWQNDLKIIDSVIFVDSNNCRSFMAKYIMLNVLNDYTLPKKIEIDYAVCTDSYNKGAVKFAADCLTKHNIPFEKSAAKTFTLDDYAKFKCVVAMDKNILWQLQKITNGDPEYKLCLLKDRQGSDVEIGNPLKFDAQKNSFESVFIKIHGCCYTLFVNKLQE
ncbi:MAG: metallophosphoesterase [Selenomonadaceae bacterium]|nr:metallophosphoesterase [Selenomonadaceae bacterium]